jgi:signal transduction histidine kinase
MRAGLLAGIIAFPLNLVLARLTGNVPSVAAVGGLAAVAAPAVLGAAIGWLRELVDEPYHREAEAVRINDEVNRRVAEHTGERLGPMMPDTLSGPWAQYVAVLVDQCMRMAGAVDSVVRLSRLVGDDESVSLVPVDLNEIVDSVVMEHQGDAQSAGLLLMFEPHRGLPKILGAKPQLALMVSSLLDNAIEHTDEGVITVSTEQVDDSAILRVEDTGSGIPPDELESILGRLRRQDPDEAVVAADEGLGLRIVQQVVDRHEGQLSATSAVGEGTTVSVTLNLVRR